MTAPSAPTQAECETQLHCYFAIESQDDQRSFPAAVTERNRLPDISPKLRWKFSSEDRIQSGSNRSAPHQISARFGEANADNARKRPCSPAGLLMLQANPTAMLRCPECKFSRIQANSLR